MSLLFITPMHDILFKGINLKKKKPKLDQCIITNLNENWSLSTEFKSDFENLIHWFIKNRKSFIIKNCLYKYKIESIIHVLDYCNFTYILQVDTNHNIISINYALNLLKNDFPSINFQDTNLETKMICLNLIYKHEFINGLTPKHKHLCIEQCINDTKNTVLIVKDKKFLLDRYPNLNIIDTPSDIPHKCTTLIFYDLINNPLDFLEQVEWSNKIRIVNIHTDEEMDEVQELSCKLNILLGIK